MIFSYIMKERQEGLTLRVECQIEQNGLLIISKKNSKHAYVNLNCDLGILTVSCKGDGKQFKFALSSLKAIIQKFISEGKMTLQFDTRGPGTVQKGLHPAQDNIQTSGHFLVLINGASPENLKLLVNNISDLKKLQHKRRCSQKDAKGLEKEKRGKKLTGSKSRLSVIEEKQEEEDRKLSRRGLLEMMQHGGKVPPKPPKQPRISLKEQDRIKVNLVDLPHLVLNQILAFCGVSLQHRLLSKKLETMVLRNIKSLRLKDQIDEVSFNKLAKWAVNVQCKMKNVKNLSLANRYDDQKLEKNRAKSLMFGSWKEVSARNIEQLKDLNIYCLQLPYSIKFDLSHLLEFKLAELRLVGHQVTVKNFNVKDEHILSMINHCKSLRTVEVAYASTKLITGIKDKHKMIEIKIGTINWDNEEQSDNWINIAAFNNLREFGIDQLHRKGVKKDPRQTEFDIKWPESLRTLSLGLNISRLSRQSLPVSLTSLALVGEHWTNDIIMQFFLPELKLLDISGAPLLTHSCLSSMANLRVHTNWNTNRVEVANEHFASNNISITSGRGFTYC